MEIKEIRKKANISQKQAAQYLSLPLRTYIRYENEEKYKTSIKYQYILEKLNDLIEINEEKGLLTIDDIKRIVDEVFKDKEIEYAYLFGSYAKNYPTERSDVDIMVSTNITGLAFFGLIEELREKLHKKVDLLRLIDINSNAELLNEIMKDGIRIYEQHKKWRILYYEDIRKYR